MGTVFGLPPIATLVVYHAPSCHTCHDVTLPALLEVERSGLRLNVIYIDMESGPDLDEPITHIPAFKLTLPRKTYKTDALKMTKAGLSPDRDGILTWLDEVALDYQEG